MQVSVQNTRADFNAFSERRLQLRWGLAYWFLRRGLSALLLILSVFLLFLLWRYHSLFSLRHNMISATLALLGIVLSRIWMFFDAFNFWLLQRAGFGRPFTVQLREDGVELHNAVGESLVFWATFRRVEHWDACLILSLGTRSALIVPDRVFASVKEVEAFASFAETRWMAAKNASDPPIAIP